jgi:hypothetical protein
MMSQDRQAGGTGRYVDSSCRWRTCVHGYRRCLVGSMSGQPCGIVGVTGSTGTGSNAANLPSAAPSKAGDLPWH